MSIHVDAALYWQGYAQFKDGKRSASIRTLKKLLQNHEKSKWADEAKTLLAEMTSPSEIRKSNNNEMKEIALHSLLNATPEKALPLLKKTLAANNTEDVKSMALFVLSQINSPEAHKLLAEIAVDNSKGELQSNAIQMLAISGDENARKTVEGLYSQVKSLESKEAVLSAMMMSKNLSGLYRVAETEKDVDLLTSAIQMIGVTGGGESTELLTKIWNENKSIEVREAVLESWMISGNSNGIINVIHTAKNPEIIGKSIEMLGIMQNEESAKALKELYAKAPNDEIKSRVLESMFMQGDVKFLIEVFRTEKNSKLKKEAVTFVSMMDSKESQDLMLEVLESQ